MSRFPTATRAFFLLAAIVLTLLALLSLGSADAPSLAVPVAEAAPLQQTLPVVSFDRASDEVIEPDNSDTTTITINVKINVAPADNREVTVSYATANGSATAGVDYVAKTGELTFPPGSIQEQSFDITILGNNLDQPNRTFIVFLTNPVNATVGIPSSITITIVDNDTAPATSTPTPTPGGNIFIDDYEPNNTFDDAFPTSANAAKLTAITLWPVGDQDYFQFFGKKGSTYEVFTTDLAAGLDTFLRVYDPKGNKIAENDDVDVTSRRSQAQISAREDGVYFARITNQDPSDAANKAYSFGVNEINPPTPTPTATLVGQPDICEPNNTLSTACLIGPGEVKNGMNFIPPGGSGQDTDFYFMPVKPGVLYTCETQNLSAANDTNIIFLDGNGGDFNPQLGNDDRAVGDKSSLLSFYSFYTGNLTIVVGPVNPPSYENSPLYTYDLVCTSVAATPTPPPTATFAFSGSTGGGTGTGGSSFATAVPSPTIEATPTAFDFTALIPTAAPPPIVGFQPLPTSTPATGVQQLTSIQLTAFFDANFNFMPELNEGISDIAVELYDNTSGTLLAFGYTNEAGLVRFDAVLSSGSIRIEVPFLSFSQVVSGASANVLLRVEPRPLPGSIP